MKNNIKESFLEINDFLSFVKITASKHFKNCGDEFPELMINNIEIDSYDYGNFHGITVDLYSCFSPATSGTISGAAYRIAYLVSAEKSFNLDIESAYPGGSDVVKIYHSFIPRIARELLLETS